MSGPRTVRAPRGMDLTCKNWLSEAAYRMIQNNLDPEVAEKPDDLVVYGGRGKAARSWEAFDAILESLKNLEEDETLLVQSGKPVVVSKVTQGRAESVDRQFQPGPALGDVGTLRRTRQKGTHHVRADDRRFMDLHRHAGHSAGHLRNFWRVSQSSKAGTR
jgi:hypothetical protein